MFRKSLYSSPQDILAASDIQIAQNRLLKIYCVLNFLFYIGQMSILTIFSTSLLAGIGSVLERASGIPQSPLYVPLIYYQLGWSVCFILQGIFVLRGLTCNSASVHYKNCLMLKIKLNFMLLCLFFALSFFLLAFVVANTDYQLSVMAIIVISNFILLKFIVVFFLYERVKYKDDGRELVGIVEFITIHVTFPVINAWSSYIVAYQCMFVLANSCPYLSTEQRWFCPQPQNQLIITPTEDQYYYSLFYKPAKILYLFLIAENLINLAYYKDVVFGLVVIIEFVAFYVNSVAVQETDGSRKSMKFWLIIMISVCSFLELSVLIFNFRSAFYIKARQFKAKEKQIRQKVEQLQLKQKEKSQDLTNNLRVTTERNRTQTLDMLGLQEYLMFEKLKSGNTMKIPKQNRNAITSSKSI